MPKLNYKLKNEEDDKHFPFSLKKEAFFSDELNGDGCFWSKRQPLDDLLPWPQFCALSWSFEGGKEDFKTKREFWWAVWRIKS